MTRLFARIDNDGECKEIVDFEPFGKFHESITWIEIPDKIKSFVREDYIYKDGEIVPPSLDYIHNQCKNRLSAIRYNHEIAGISMADGTKVGTSREEYTKMVNLYQSMVDGTVDEVEWKVSNDKWLTVTKNEFKNIIDTVVVHVDNSFKAEKMVSELIRSYTDFNSLYSFDIEKNFLDSYNSLIV